MDWDKILTRVQRNAIQMCLDFKNNKQAEDYSYDIDLIDGVKIAITVKRIQNSTDLEVHYNYHDNNKPVYPVPHEDCYYYSDYIVEDKAKDFVYAIKGIWDYEDEE